jgi:uncharacterized protein DUF6980
MMEEVSKFEHCCETMESILERGESALHYEDDIRTYLIWEILFKKGKIYLGACNIIRYCPWCGKKLPEKLGKKMEEILEKEYKLINPWSSKKKMKLIPQEFQTDEWWKKRGL